jgi:curved DNA-binding protein CbpA
MKQTLYQILGVDSKASAQEIEAAYIARIDELKFATLQDPNKLRVLQQSKEVLSDANRRATYDASLAVPVAAATNVAEEEPEPSFLQQWGKWIAVGVAVIIVGIWWAKHGASPPPQKPRQPTAVAQPVAPAPVPNPTPTPSAAPVASVAVPAAEPPPADAPASPVAGEWSCTDAISGHDSKYNFQQNGVLRIVTNEGQASEAKYELSGKELTVTDDKQVGTYTVEELVARKMILNAGAGGRRVVCKR